MHKEFFAFPFRFLSNRKWNQNVENPILFLFFGCVVIILSPSVVSEKSIVNDVLTTNSNYYCGVFGFRIESHLHANDKIHHHETDPIGINLIIICTFQRSFFFFFNISKIFHHFFFKSSKNKFEVGKMLESRIFLTSKLVQNIWILK